MAVTTDTVTMDRSADQLPTPTSALPAGQAPAPLVDIGVNLTSGQFRDDLAPVLARAAAAQVTTLLLTGSDLADSEAALALCRHWQEGFPGTLACTAGCHPHQAGDLQPEHLQQLRALCADPAVIAVGETGLDFNRNYSPQPAQEWAFASQLELAAATGLPLFLHERDAFPRFADLVAEHSAVLGHGVVHCFTGSREALYRYLDQGWMIGVTGWLCDERRGQALRELVPAIPADRLLIETDAPYLQPRDLRPKPRSRRNEPALLPHILNTVAHLRGEDPATLAATTSANARRLFSKLDSLNPLTD